jgi:LAS superfamily LD-carboxypeptidase LdcB
MQPAQLTGESESHIVYRSSPNGLCRHGLTRASWQAFDRLQQAAAEEGFDLQIVSAFRNAERQQLIWDAKALGRRPVLDAQCKPLDISCLSEYELLLAIMRWSALPCTSRHHWGTDLDIYDAAAVDEDYQIQLVAEEYTGSGPFAALGNWLDSQIGEGQSAGFFKPYAIDRGGVAPEAWHISYAPEAFRCQLLLDEEQLLAAIHTRRPCLFDVVEQNWTQLYSRFIAVPDSAYPPQP